MATQKDIKSRISSVKIVLSFVRGATDDVQLHRYGIVPGSRLDGDAAAASGCFPIAFAAMRVPYEPSRAPGTYDGPDRESLLRTLQVTDGGLYDNMAIEPIWRDHAAVLASDASPSFSYAPRWFGQLWLALRYPVTLLEQAVDIRKRWLVASYIRGDLEGSYWGIASEPANYEFSPKAYDPPVYAYSTELIREVISQIRIDFDAFSEAEIAVLENHGYLLAEIAVRRHAAKLVDGPWPRPEVPHGDWMASERESADEFYSKYAAVEWTQRR